MSDRWGAVPLSGRLVAIITILLLIGLAGAGVTTVTVLRAHLIGQVDEELTSRGGVLAQESFEQLIDRRERPTVLPSNYYVAIQDGTGMVYEVPNPHVVEEIGRPRLPAVDLDALRHESPRPVTLPGAGGSPSWRAVTFPIGREPVGAVTVALPLYPTYATTASIGRLLLLSGLVIATLGAVAAWAAVRRSLRPLREIEATAGAIAAGDLSRRVPTPPPTTEVGSLARSLNVMLTQIEASFGAQQASERRMRQFVSDASHELRTPLSTIRGYGELYRMGGVEDTGQAMARIESEAKRMGALVEDLLQLARLDEGRPLELGPVDLAAVAADAVADLHALAPDRAAAVVALEPGGAAPQALVVRADENKIRQVVANLMGNVLQHTPPGTPVEIAVGEPEPGWALVEVRDHGPGISAEDASRVFERFYRVDPSRTRSSGGSGLGLAIVAAIVGTHHGGVRVAPTPGGGTTVEVAVPVAGPQPLGPRPAAPEPDGPQPNEPPAPTPAEEAQPATGPVTTPGAPAATSRG
ncbi:sensor histidine kinase [Georgenia yuyongxinii]|uniref:sensor histidine kinase n=1 Tax=Georgenia yuyongxinii TaxID=2589797 RepID=UPI001E6465E5|nr:HAMP domain-containing sensor histidine kinase [Georgenia yuyongxinii]